MDRKSPGALTLFRFAGVPVRAHWTLLLVLPWLALVFATQFGAVTTAAGVERSSVVLPPPVWGLLLAIGLFASVALHELAHTFVAMHSGGKVREITLMLLGGVSRFEEMPRAGATEALVAVVGPLTSLVLGGVLYGLHGVIDPRALADLRMGVFYLGEINITLGLFNLLPAFPMDGGRILRGLLETQIGSLRATRIATGVGRVLAVLMGLTGLLTGSLLLLLVAIFVYAGGREEAAVEETRALLTGVRVVDLGVARPEALTLDVPLREVPARMRAAGRLDLPVVDSQGATVGVLRVADLRDLPEGARVVGDLGERLRTAAVVASPSEPAAEALSRAAHAGADVILVVEPGHPEPLGLVNLIDARRTLELRRLEHADEPRMPFPGRPREA